MPRTKSNSQARERLLDTADRLFYREGIRAVGIDRIIAEAGVAKMTLYAHFASKDALILAALARREEVVLEFFRSAMEKHRKRAKSSLLAFFAALKDLLGSAEFRGCAFANALIELADPSHPGPAFVRGYKRRFAKFLRGLIEESIGKEAAAKVAPAVAMLVEGALVTSAIHGPQNVADVARDASLVLIRGAQPTASH